MTPTLQWHDLAWILRRVPLRALEAVKASKGTVVIAGGCIRSCVAQEEVHDVDLFTATPEQALELANSLAPDHDRKKDEQGLLPGIVATKNAFTLLHFKPPVQIIHRWNFSTPQNCLNSFDFTICQAAVWSDGTHWLSEVSPNFYADLAAKRLIYTRPIRIEESGGSLLRVLKFYQRGYRIPLDSLAAVVARFTSAVGVAKRENVEEFVDIANETKAAEQLLPLLREVDPEVDPMHLAHLPAQLCDASPPH